MGGIFDFIGDVVEDIIDVVEDVVEGVVDVVEDVVDFAVDVVEEVVSWIIPIPEVPNFDTDGYNDPTQTNDGVLVNKRSSSRGIPVIYGLRRIGGTIVYLETDNVNNRTLMGILVLGEGQFNALKKIYLDDIEVTDLGTSSTNPNQTSPSSFTHDQIYYGKFADREKSNGDILEDQFHFALQFKDGRDNQTRTNLFTGISNSITTAHRLRGVAYVAFRFTYNPDVFQSLPKITCLVQGRKVRSVDSGGNISGTYAYSSNPAFCLLDYLTNTRFGKGVADSDIDGQTFYDASQVASTTVNPVDVGNVTDPNDGSSSTTIDLMNLCIVLDTRNKVLNNIRTILSNCRGFLTYSAGLYKMTIESTSTPAITLDESDILGGIQIKSEDKTIKYNKVIIDFPDIERDFRTSTASFPPNDDSGLPSADQHATLLAEDGGELLEGRFSFTGITSYYQAEEHAEIVLRRSRNSLRVSLKATGKAMDLTVGDTVNITHATPAFSSKPFRVTGVNLNKDQTVNLNLVEHQDAFYTFGTKRVPKVISDTNLPDPTTVPTVGITEVTDELIELTDGSIVSKLNIEVASDYPFSVEFEVQLKLSSETKYRSLGFSKNTSFEKFPVKEGQVYNIRARAINSFGAKSSFTTVNHTVFSAFTPPADITDYSIELSGDKLIHQWTPPTDLDLSHFVIRYSKKANETKFANGIIIGDKIPKNTNRFVTPIFNDGTYMIKAVDLFGVASENFDSVVLDFDAETQVFGKDFKSVQTITEEPDFTGTKTDCVAVENVLKLDTSTLFDDTAGDFDDALGLFDSGFGNVVASGSYEFDGFDFSNKFPFKLLLHDLDVTHLNYSDSFDAQQGILFDAKEGLFDDADTAQQENVTDVKLFVATSDDNVSFSAFKEFENGDFIARAVKFKAVLSTTNPDATPVVENLAIKIILPKLTQSDNDVVSLSGADKVIDYDNSFYEKPQLTVTAEDMLSGDYFTVSNSDRTGFDISFYDSTNSRVVRNFSYNSIGIGQQQ